MNGWIEGGRDVKRRVPGNTTWSHSFVDVEPKILYCLWRGEDEDPIRACFRPPDLENAPIESIREIILSTSHGSFDLYSIISQSQSWNLITT